MKLLFSFQDAQQANSFFGLSCKDWTIGLLMALLSTVLPPSQNPPNENAIWRCENPTVDTAAAAAGTTATRNYHQHPQQS